MVEKIPIDVDVTPAFKTLTDLETARQNIIQGINTTCAMARTAYLGMTSIVRIGGGTVSTLFSSVISAGISMISILTPILTAQATTGDYIRAGIGFVNLGIATGAIIAAELQQIEIANKLHSANALMHSAQMLVSVITPYW